MTIVFAPHQIVYLACDQSHLYAEVIQVLEARQMCWVRPIVLVHGVTALGTSQTGATPGKLEIYSIQDGPDILWPLSQFDLALDIDVIPLLATIRGDKAEPAGSAQTTTQQLRRFMEQLWARRAEGH
jgi:hypothetical protein